MMDETQMMGETAVMVSQRGRRTCPPRWLAGPLAAFCNYVGRGEMSEMNWKKWKKSAYKRSREGGTSRDGLEGLENFLRSQ